MYVYICVCVYIHSGLDWLHIYIYIFMFIIILTYSSFSDMCLICSCVIFSMLTLYNICTCIQCRCSTVAADLTQ